MISWNKIRIESLKVLLSRNRTWTSDSQNRSLSPLTIISRLICLIFISQETFLKSSESIYLPRFILPEETLKTHPPLILPKVNRRDYFLTHKKRKNRESKQKEAFLTHVFDFMEISVYCLCFAHFVVGQPPFTTVNIHLYYRVVICKHSVCISYKEREFLVRISFNTGLAKL